MATAQVAALVAKWKPPYPEFPLGIHKPTGQLCRKIKGSVRYFGLCDDWRSALKLYELERVEWEAGRNPRAQAGTVLVRAGDAADRQTLNAVMQSWLKSQQALRATDEICHAHYVDKERTVTRTLDWFGRDVAALDIMPDEWGAFRHALQTGNWRGEQRTPLGPDGLNRAVAFVREASAWAAHEDVALLPRGFRFGQRFDRVGIEQIEAARAAGVRARGPKLFPLADVPTIINECMSSQLEAMALLAFNAAYTSIDCARLDWKYVHFDTNLIDMPRVKTKVPRTAWLWPETRAALLRLRDTPGLVPAPADPAHKSLVFITKEGNPWVREIVKPREDGKGTKVIRVDSVGQEFRKVLERKNLYRKGVVFGSGRHTFFTSASGHPDTVAANFVMGHRQKGMRKWYIHLDPEGVQRIRQLCLYVRWKLLGKRSKRLGKGRQTISANRERSLRGRTVLALPAPDAGRVVVEGELVDSN
jgi:hypothetical protein